MVKTRDPFERPTAQKTKSQVRRGRMKTSPAVSQTGTSAVGQIYHREQLPFKVGCGLKGGPIGNDVPPWLQAKVKLLGLGWLCQCVRVPWTAHEWVRRTEASDRRPLGLCCKMSQLLVGRAVNSEVACYSFQGDFFCYLSLYMFRFTPFHSSSCAKRFQKLEKTVPREHPQTWRGSDGMVRMSEGLICERRHDH